MSQPQRDPTPQRRPVARSPDANNEKKNVSRSPAPTQPNVPQIIQYWGSPIFPKRPGDKTQFMPIKVDEEIFQIIPGETHIHLVSKKNTLYSLGSNDFGQLGLGKVERALTAVGITAAALLAGLPTPTATAAAPTRACLVTPRRWTATQPRPSSIPPIPN